MTVSSVKGKELAEQQSGSIIRHAAAPMDQTSPICTLALEILAQCCSFLTPAAYAKVAGTCRYLYSVLYGPQMLQVVVPRHCPANPGQLIKGRELEDYRKRCKEEVRLGSHYATTKYVYCNSSECYQEHPIGGRVHRDGFRVLEDLNSGSIVACIPETQVERFVEARQQPESRARRQWIASRIVTVSGTVIALIAVAAFAALIALHAPAIAVVGAGVVFAGAVAATYCGFRHRDSQERRCREFNQAAMIPLIRAEARVEV